jgi:N-acetylneuraminic acid mutarotase
MLSANRWMRGLVGAGAIALLSTSVVGQGQGKWLNLAPFPEPSQEILGTAAGGKVYVFGGLGLANNEPPKGIVWVYDEATDKWAKKKRMPLPAHHVAVVEHGGKIYLFAGGAQAEPGGMNWVPIDNAWEYNPVADTWRALPPVPTPRVSPVAALVGNKIYVLGGASVHPGQKLVDISRAGGAPHRAVPTNEVFDLTTQKWETRSPMPTARDHAAVGVVNGKVYVLGGRVGSVNVTASPTDVVEEYDPATDRWGVAKARMPLPRSGTAYGVYNNKIFVAGGEYLDNDIVGTFRDFEAYDPATDSWTAYPPMAMPRHGLVGGVMGHRFYLVSGHLQSAGIHGGLMDSDETNAFDFRAK